jgi:hypothetical protein
MTYKTHHNNKMASSFFRKIGRTIEKPFTRKGVIGHVFTKKGISGIARGIKKDVNWVDKNVFRPAEKTVDKLADIPGIGGAFYPAQKAIHGITDPAKYIAKQADGIYRGLGGGYSAKKTSSKKFKGKVRKEAVRQASQVIADPVAFKKSKLKEIADMKRRIAQAKKQAGKRGKAVGKLATKKAMLEAGRKIKQGAPEAIASYIVRGGAF